MSGEWGGTGVRERAREASALRRTAEASRVEVALAPLAGFCPGVARAIRIALEARRVHPAARVRLLGAIVHNASVNRSLAAAGVEVLAGPEAAGSLGAGDVAIVPAFGAPAGLAGRLRAAGVLVADATCPNVEALFSRSEALGRAGADVVVFGDPSHEETRATLSRIEAAGGRGVCVADEGEAESVAKRWGESPTSKVPRPESTAFAAGAGGGAADGTPVGYLCQTTACPIAARRIGRILKRALPGLLDASAPCPATRARQAALQDVLRQGADLSIVVGGRDSRNTACLRALAARRVPAFHVESAGDLLDARLIRHVVRGRVRVSRDWLPRGTVRVALTAGASTPDETIRGVAARLTALGRREGGGFHG